jgi:predicted nicotinamide N-methyase
MAKEPFSEPFLTICHSQDNDDPNSDSKSTPIYFEEDWHTGIGGGLWSTGLAFSKYLTTAHALENLQKISSQQQQPIAGSHGISVLELGSGNGLLSVCILALSQHQRHDSSNHPIIEDLAITDMADHLPLIHKTLDANSHILSGVTAAQKTRVHVFEHSWGEFLPPSTEETSEDLSLQHRVQQGDFKFDLILGSDVAYHEDLYDILIASLLQYSNDKTMILIGVTMADTKPKFFHRLRKAGFNYQKFADHLLEPDFRGRIFGIFKITLGKK